MKFVEDYSKMSLEELKNKRLGIEKSIEYNNQRYIQNLATKANSQQELDMLNDEEKRLVGNNTYLNNQLKLIDKAIAEAEAKLQMQ